MLDMPTYRVPTHKCEHPETKGLIMVGLIVTKMSHFNEAEPNALSIVDSNKNYYTCCLEKNFVVI